MLSLALRGKGRAMANHTEDEVPFDEKVANSRPENQEGDPEVAENTTGPGGNGEFVGRISGQDEGYAGETGAERRAAAKAAEGDA
jgi:hypothetical protein